MLGKLSTHPYENTTTTTGCCQAASSAFPIYYTLALVFSTFFSKKQHVENIIYLRLVINNLCLTGDPKNIQRFENWNLSFQNKNLVFSSRGVQLSDEYLQEFYK